jgi:hypothetical protein
LYFEFNIDQIIVHLSFKYNNLVILSSIYETQPNGNIWAVFTNIALHYMVSELSLTYLMYFPHLSHFEL